MARWCLRNDYALNDDEKWNSGCTDEWGTHHQCEGCPITDIWVMENQYQFNLNNYDDN